MAASTTKSAASKTTAVKKTAAPKKTTASKAEAAEVEVVPAFAGYKSEILAINGTMATAMLARTKCNTRPLSMSKVKDLMHAIRSGEWKVTHQGIALDDCPGGGCVLDGQHRLTAIKMLETDTQEVVSIPVQVTYDVPSAYFTDIDTGKARNPADLAAIALNNPKYSNIRSTVARTLYCRDQGWSWDTWGKRKLTSQELVGAILKYSIEDSKLDELKDVARGSDMTHTAVVVGWYLCHRAWPDGKHDEFLTGLRTQSDMPNMKDPRRILYQNLRNSSKTRRRPGFVQQAAMYIKAWNAWNEGRDYQVMTMSSTHRWPTPYIPKND